MHMRWPAITNSHALFVAQLHGTTAMAGAHIVNTCHARQLYRHFADCHYGTPPALDLLLAHYHTICLLLATLRHAKRHESSGVSSNAA